MTSYTKALLENTLGALPDGILIVGPQRQMVYVNDRFREIWGIPFDIKLENEAESIMGYALNQLDDHISFISKVESLNNSDESYEDELKLKDGRMLRRRSESFIDEALGRCRIWIFTDITELKKRELDALTGLKNRFVYEREFSGSMIDAGLEAPIAVAILDFDEFKLFNDENGHSAGDDALRCLGNILLTHLDEQTDSAYRIGGDEFLVVCRGRSSEQVYTLLDTIRVSMESAKIHIREEKQQGINLSIGVVICKSYNDSQKVFELADSCLYTAKHSGKNRIELVEI